VPHHQLDATAVFFRRVFQADFSAHVGVDLANEELGGIYPLNCLIGIDLYVRKSALQSSHMPNEKKIKIFISFTEALSSKK
jgi:hypothetical protein